MTDTSALEPAEYRRRLFDDFLSSPTWLWWQRNWALPIFLHLAHGRSPTSLPLAVVRAS